jgi:hypothetical protein
MSIPVLREIRSALRNLNPHEVRELAAREFTVGIFAGDEEGYRRMIRFLAPESVSARKAQQAGRYVAPIRSEADFKRCDLGLAEPHLPRPSHFYAFDPQNGNRLVDSILDRHGDLWVPLARRFVAFRGPVIERFIRKISRENALFAVATALPDVIPSFVELPWAVGEFASDTAVLTMNQIRLAFLIAAASDVSIGYVEQRGQIASIITSAFGWRAIARELVAKIPFGGGLVPKGLVAYAGTYVVGLGLERYLRIGRGLTAEEKRDQYKRAYERGRVVVEEIVARFRPMRAKASSRIVS